MVSRYYFAIKPSERERVRGGGEEEMGNQHHKKEKGTSCLTTERTTNRHKISRTDEQTQTNS